MKKLFCMMLALIALCALTACGNSRSAFDHSTAACDSADLEEKAVRCMSGYVHAKAPEDACAFAVADSTDAIKKDLNLFAGKTYQVEANYLGRYDHYDIFRFTIRLAENSKVAMTPLMVLQPHAEEYKLCLLSSVLQTIENHCKCTTCQGSGQVYNGGNVCAICAGTGWQYIPNAYYDVALNMWQGQNVVCSGCAGAGHTGGNQLTCGICHGIGLILD